MLTETAIIVGVAVASLIGLYAVAARAIVAVTHECVNIRAEADARLHEAIRAQESAERLRREADKLLLNAEAHFGMLPPAEDKQ